MRNGFSFIEVLVSIVILATLGSALLKFNSFNKRAMEKNILSQENIFLSSSVLYIKDIDKKITTDKEEELYDLISFEKLSDKDRKFLKSITVSISVDTEDKVFLLNDGKENKYIEYGNIRIKQNENKLSYLWLKDSK
ncbi:MAG: type II secretion system protein [Campylobacterota bacterium]|nr:type II secretion system protein [Campylobacterota bacterium]